LPGESCQLEALVACKAVQDWPVSRYSRLGRRVLAEGCLQRTKSFCKKYINPKIISIEDGWFCRVGRVLVKVSDAVFQPEKRAQR
jgi:hypothetical protein